MDGFGRFRHLHALSDHRGIFEHALLDVPRREHGYCTDDVARALIVVEREPERRPELDSLAEIYLAFLEASIDTDGFAHNRMNEHGAWIDEAGMGDWWGRLLWALGTATARSADPSVRDRSLRAFSRAAQQGSHELRTAAFAALGASEVLSARPDDAAARRLLRQYIDMFPVGDGGRWVWPEPRLRYANATVVEALLAAGDHCGDEHAFGRGLHLLRFLLGTETSSGWLSVAGTEGRGPDDAAPLFDQQPIEVAAIADACARAFELTDDEVWREGVELSWRWFEGLNDSGTRMVDEVTGAGFDGLEPTGRNENRGAESTLAALSTFQQAHRLGVLSAA